MGSRTGESVASYESAIVDESSRLALNSLTKQCIESARHRNERLRFSSKGVDAFGSARRFMLCQQRFGENDDRTRQAERVFDNDILTGLFEETEQVFVFSVNYPIENDGTIMMGELPWQDLAANGGIDPNADSWYQQRAFVEVREAVLANDYLRQGVLDENDIVTISNTSTAQNANDYFSGEDLMVRRISFNDQLNQVNVEQLMMYSVSNEIIQSLYDTLQVEVDEVTTAGCDDASAKYLATQIRVKKGELLNGVADVGFLLDVLAKNKTKKLHLFGKQVDSVEGNPYATIARLSRQKELRRKNAVDQLKADFLEMVSNGNESLERQKELYQSARGYVADIEGRDFVSERYGEAAAQQFDRRQTAIERGDWGGISRAEASMQHEMGDVIICGTVMGASRVEFSAAGDALGSGVLCPKLPKPGEKARCPCCRRSVVVEGTLRQIYCPKEDCRLSNPKKRKKSKTKKEEDTKKFDGWFFRLLVS
jgi:hypothetical protein